MQLLYIISLLILQLGICQASPVKQVEDSLATSGESSRTRRRPGSSGSSSGSDDGSADDADSRFLNAKTRPYRVDGTDIPLVQFDAGESYAGLLPISSTPGEKKKLFFWFWPVKTKGVPIRKDPVELGGDPDREGEIMIWLNGGPGGSSLLGFLQELGSFMWAPGTDGPYRNTWSPTNFTHVVFVEFPVGTGYTTGPVTATSEEEISADFLGFWKNFVTLFSLQHSKIYIVGESYAGYFAPYIGSAMLDAAQVSSSANPGKDTTFYDLRGTLLVSPVITSKDGIVYNNVGVAPFVKANNNILNLSLKDRRLIQYHDGFCEYDTYLRRYLTYPPPGPIPPPHPRPARDGYVPRACNTGRIMRKAARYQNRCFNKYNILNNCPRRSNEFSPSPESGKVPYFNRDDVKMALNVPVGIRWREMNPRVFAGTERDHAPNDRSEMPTAVVLPKVIEATERTVIMAGAMDGLTIHTGIELGIQNMTWRGMQGFLFEQTLDFVVDEPSWREPVPETYSAYGILGKVRAERKLTYILLQRAGHSIPLDAPAAFYKTLQFLMGKRHDIAGGYDNRWG